jgi:hypothetical protein
MRAAAGLDRTHLNRPLEVADIEDPQAAEALLADIFLNTLFAIQPKGGSLRDGLARWHEKAADKACIDYGFHANVTDAHDGIYAEIPHLVEEGVTSIKLLMAYKGTFQVDDTALF